MDRWGEEIIDLMTNLLASTDFISHIKSRIQHSVLPIFYATFRSHKTIRSMHRCPPQLDRPLSNPEALVVPECSFIFCSAAVPRPRATFSHRNRDILSRIARVSCDPFFFPPLDAFIEVKRHARRRRNRREENS